MKDNKNNSGDYNSGYYNSGDRNSGHYNSGNYNSGNRNSGNYNSGNRNSGYCNSGYYNSGYYNSGDHNSGNYNSGNYNSGKYNSGHYNSGNYNSGYFNTTEPTVRLFNKDSGKLRKDISVPYIGLPLTEWKNGKLITLNYKEAWDKAWNDMKDVARNRFLTLPNFDSTIFKEITGIDVNVKKETCDNKVVEIDGKKYKLTLVE